MSNFDSQGHKFRGYHEIIEAVTVCVGYGDFLREVIPQNQGLFDRWIIVTSPDDTETREVCRRYSVETLLSNDHKRGGDDFNKGLLIDRGLAHLRANGWRVHIDGDILLPSNFRNLLKAAHLDTQNLYGIDRIMVKSKQHLKELRNGGFHHGNDYHCRVHFPENYQTGSRWADWEHGYCPIGFFQMWHSDTDQYNGSRIKRYPTEHNDACRTDVQFAMQWDRRNRVLLPEITALHIESEPAALGANWKGRTTKRWE